MSMTADDFFSGGTPSAKFDSVGVTVAGTITRVGEPMQQRDFTTQKPKTWDDGRPMMQLPVDIKTDLRDPEISHDDGTRAIYIKGELQKAIRQAVRTAGAPGLRVGGHLTVTYTGDGVASQRGMNPPKLYSAVYTAPTAAAGDQFLGGGAPAPAATPAATQQSNGYLPPAQPAAARGEDPALVAAMAHLPVEQQNAIRAGGLTAAQVQAMYPAPANH